MDNCTYNKAKLLHVLSKVAGFVKMYAIQDVKGVHSKCKSYMTKLHKDLTSHIEKLQKAL